MKLMMLERQRGRNVAHYILEADLKAHGRLRQAGETLCYRSSVGRRLKLVPAEGEYVMCLYCKSKAISHRTLIEYSERRASAPPRPPSSEPIF